MIYCFDIDGTICSNTNGRYKEAKPYFDRIKKINSLYEKGHTIYFQTARGSTTGQFWNTFTMTQLKRWGVKFHKLCFEKPHADFYIDDKGENARDFFSKK